MKTAAGNHCAPIVILIAVFGLALLFTSAPAAEPPPPANAITITTAERKSSVRNAKEKTATKRTHYNDRSVSWSPNTRRGD